MRGGILSPGLRNERNGLGPLRFLFTRREEMIHDGEPDAAFSGGLPDCIGAGLASLYLRR
jgi:hypothetical protein